MNRRSGISSLSGVLSNLNSGLLPATLYDVTQEQIHERIARCVAPSTSGMYHEEVGVDSSRLLVFVFCHDVQRASQITSSV